MGESLMLYRSMPVKWWELINEMEALTQRTGFGLARTWGLVHAGRYREARRAFDEVARALDEEAT